MTPELQRKVALATQKTWVQKIPFFNASSDWEREKFITAISIRLLPCAFPPDETVYWEGERADRMYIIVRGVMRRRETLMSRGGFFGEEMVSGRRARVRVRVRVRVGRDSSQ